MKRLEGEVLEAIADLGGQPDRYSDFPDDAGSHRVGRKLASSGGRFTVDPHQFYGLELNPRAVPIADLVLWIGFLKWQIRTGVDISEPVLDAYGTIRQQDAVLAHEEETPALDEDGQPRTRWDGFTRKPDPITGGMVPDASARVPITAYTNPRRAPWPEAEFVIGNPPFIAGKDMRAELGDGYAEAAWAARSDVPGGADFVMHFWDEAARRLTAKGTKARPNPTRRFGFITTNSITQTFSRRVIEQRPKGEPPFSLVFAVGDHPWLKSSDRAAVRIAMTVAQAGSSEGVLGEVVEEADLSTDAPRVRLRRTSGKITSKLTLGADLSQLKNLWANKKMAHKGYQLNGDGFIVDQSEALRLRAKGSPYQCVIREYFIGWELNQRARHRSVIDLFGTTREKAAREFPDLFQILAERVRPERETNSIPYRRDNWWLFGQPSEEIRQATDALTRFVVTARQGKHRVFHFASGDSVPESTVVCIASDEAKIHAVFSSRIHTVFSLGNGGWMGVGNDPRYFHTKTFNPFPLPILGEENSREIEEACRTVR